MKSALLAFAVVLCLCMLAITVGICVCSTGCATLVAFKKHKPPAAAVAAAAPMETPPSVESVDSVIVHSVIDVIPTPDPDPSSISPTIPDPSSISPAPPTLPIVVPSPVTVFTDKTVRSVFSSVPIGQLLSTSSDTTLNAIDIAVGCRMQASTGTASVFPVQTGSYDLRNSTSKSKQADFLKGSTFRLFYGPNVSHGSVVTPADLNITLCMMEAAHKLWTADFGPGNGGVGYGQGMSFVTGTGLSSDSSADPKGIPAFLPGSSGLAGASNVYVDSSVAHDKEGENITVHEVGHFETSGYMAFVGGYAEQFGDFVRHYCCPSNSYTYLAALPLLRNNRHMNHLAARFKSADLTDYGPISLDTSYNGGFFWAFFVTQFGRRSFFNLLKSRKMRLTGANGEHSVEAWGVITKHVGLKDPQALLDLWLRDTLTLAYLRRDALRMAAARKYLTNQKKQTDDIVDANLMWTHCNTQIVPLEPFGFAVHNVATLCTKAKLVAGTQARLTVESALPPVNWVFVFLRVTGNASPSPSTYELMSTRGGSSTIVVVPGKGIRLIVAIAHTYTGSMKGNRLQVGSSVAVPYVISIAALS